MDSWTQIRRRAACPLTYSDHHRSKLWEVYRGIWVLIFVGGKAGGKNTFSKNNNIAAKKISAQTPETPGDALGGPGTPGDARGRPKTPWDALGYRWCLVMAKHTNTGFQYRSAIVFAQIDRLRNAGLHESFRKTFKKRIL